MIDGKAKCSHQQMTNRLSVNWSVFMFICSADRDQQRPAVKVARLLIKSYRLEFILLDSEEYVLSNFKSVRCFSNLVFISIQK